MNEILKKIERANETQIDILLEMVMKRKRELYPDWEIIYYAYKKGEPDGLEQLLPLLGRKI